METKLDKIKEKFKIIKDEAIVDCNFDRENIDTQFNNTMVICKWINKKQEWNSVQRVFEQQRIETWRKLYEFYKKDYNLQINTKEELNLFITSDTQYTQINFICMSVKEVLGYIDSILDNLKNKNYLLKEYLAYQYFINGR